MSVRLLLAALALGALLAGCGVKGVPEPKGDRADGYPRPYPEGAVPPESPPPNILLERWRPWP